MNVRVVNTSIVQNGGYGNRMTDKSKKSRSKF